MAALGFQKWLWVWMQSSRLNVVLAGVVGRGETCDDDNEAASSSDNFLDIEDRRDIDDNERTSSDRSAAAPARQRTAQVVPPIARRCLRRVAATFPSCREIEVVSSSVANGRELLDALRFVIVPRRCIDRGNFKGTIPMLQGRAHALVKAWFIRWLLSDF